MTQRSVGIALLAGAATVWLFHGWAALQYPLGNDPAIFQFHAWAMTAGDVPYRDSFEFNTPGIILLHYGFASLFGFSDLPFLLFAVLVSALSVAGGAFALRRRCAILPIAFGVAVATWAFVGVTPWDRGQRELFQGVLLLAAFGLGSSAGRAERRGRGVGLAGLGGLCAGAAISLKLTAGLLVMGLFLFFVLHVRRAARTVWLERALAAAMGAMVPLVAVTLWLLVSGAAQGFVEAQRLYLPLHGGLLTVPISDAMAKTLPQALLALGVAVLAVAAVVRERPAARALWPLGFVILSSVALYLLQRHGWTYHLHTALPALGVATALAADELSQRLAPRRGAWVVAGAAAALLGQSAVNVRYDAGPGLVRAEHVGEHWNHGSHAAVAAYLRAHGEASDRVLTNNDEHQLLLMAQRRAATPYLYGFLASESHPREVLRTLGLERVRLLERRPARWVVWNDRPYRPELDTLDRNPELKSWIATRCTLDIEVEPYRVWRCR